MNTAIVPLTFLRFHLTQQGLQHNYLMGMSRLKCYFIIVMRKMKRGKQAGKSF